jgi:hypothetical protein
MLIASSYWSLLGVLLSAFSTCFLLNDLKNRRTYLIVGGEDTSERKVVIRHDRSPLLFNIIVVGVACCTAFTLVTCLVVLVSAVELARLLGGDGLLASGFSFHTFCSGTDLRSSKRLGKSFR